MATIVQKYNKFYVTYTLPKDLNQDFYERNGLKSDTSSPRSQMWEPFASLEAAEERKRLVETQIQEIKQSKGEINHLTVIRPIKVWDFIEKTFIPAKAKKWQPKTYSANTGLLLNHVKPHLGDKLIQAVTTKDIEDLYKTLTRIPKGAFKLGKCVLSQEEMERERPAGECLGPTTIHDVALLVGSIFQLALKKQVITFDPLPDEIPEKSEPVDFEIWDDELVFKAMDNMKDRPILRLAVHLAFVGALRNGEAVGISLEELDLKHQRIHITKTLQRVNKEDLKKAKNTDVLYVFPTVQAEKKSVNILKKPKTHTSCRELLMTEPLVEEVKARLIQLKKDKEALGDRYHDYGLLLCLENGNPIEPKLLLNWFRQWQNEQLEKHGDIYPSLKFHGLRHSAATYYVENCEGDFKNVQAITGHKSLEVLLNIYAHANLPARKRLVETFQKKFYGENAPQSLAETFTAPEGEENQMLSVLMDIAKDNQEVKGLLLQMCSKNPNLQQTVLTALLAG